MKSNPIVSLSLAFSLALPLLACSSLPRQDFETTYHPRGPGATFVTLDAAVMDALAYANDEAARTRTRHLFRGGAIVKQDGVYSYEEVNVAPPDDPTRIEYELGPKHVARFHAYPRAFQPEINLRSERPSRQDRQSVDQVDPLHRPLFILTPRLLVKAYHGSAEPVELVADLRTYAPEQMVADASD
jgi:hypothetical protein